MSARFSYKTDAQADSRANPVNLLEAERARIRDIERKYGNNADPSQENNNIQKLRKREQAGNATNIPFVNMDSIRNNASRFAGKTAEAALGPWGKALQKVRKNGPAGALIGGGILFFGLAVFWPLGNPLIGFAQHATDERANASRSRAAVFAKRMEFTVNNDKVAAACAKNVSSFTCMRGTLSGPQKQLYEEGKFKVEGEQVGNRFLVKSFTTPDGVKIDSGKKFTERLSGDLDFARLVGRVHNVRALVFTGGRMLKKVLIPRFGANKTPIKENAPKDPEERKKFLSKLYGIGDQGTIDEEKAKEKVRLKANELSKGLKAGSKATGGAAVIGATCTLYNSARLTLNIAKAQRFITAVQIVLPYLKANSQIRDKGQIEPDTASTLTNQITARDENGQTAMDAPEVKELFGAKNTGVSNALQSYLLFNNPILQNANKIIDTIDNGIASTPGLGGAKTMRAVCREVNSLTALAVQLAICGIATAAGSVVPGAGNAAGFVSTCGAQMVGGFATSIVLSTVGNQLFENFVLPWVVNTAIENLPGADAIGPQLGTVLGIGAAVLMNNVNRSNGLVPLKNKRALSAYNTAIGDSERLYKEVQIADARDTPFDTANKYSFLGSIVNTLSTRVVSNQSRIQSGHLAFQRLFSSWSLAPSVLASAGESESLITEENLRPCQDNAARLMGYQCDSSDQAMYGNLPRALTMSEEENDTYLKEHNLVDKEVGAPMQGSNLEKFMTYCEDGNELGIAAESIESEDFDWASKERCSEDSEEMAHIQRYALTEADIDDSQMSEGEGAGGIGVSVMSYNILGTRASVINDNSGGIKWEDRLNNAVAAVKSADQDIIGFQEVTGAGKISQFTLLKQGLSDAYESFPDTENNYSTRPIFWKSNKFDILDSGTYSYPRKGETGVFPWVKLRIKDGTDKEMYVFNTHSSAGDDVAKERKTQAEMLVAAIKKEAPIGSSVIITGDFNSSCELRGSDKGVSAAGLPCAILQSAGFEDAGEAAHLRGVTTNFNYDSSHGSPNSLDKRSEKGIHIDHVFYSRDISVQRWENIITTNTEKASDHTPITASLSMVAPQTAGNTSGECPIGTTLVDGITEGHELNNAAKKTITLCSIPGTRIVPTGASALWIDTRYNGTTAAKIKQITVNADIAAQTLEMAQYAKSKGHTLEATISYRSFYEQCSIILNHYSRPKECPKWIKAVGGGWSSNAKYSNHNLGRSIDFYASSITWMKKNGSRFGFIDDVNQRSLREEGRSKDKPHFTGTPKKSSSSVDTR